MDYFGSVSICDDGISFNNMIYDKANVVIDELICDIDGYEMIKPCKYGNIDGVEIHNRYWKRIGDK